MKPKSKEPVLAMGWYNEDQWNILKELQPDALDDSYEIWRRNANRAIQEMTQADHDIKKFSVKIDVFLQWCEQRGVEPNGESRSAYAAWKLQQRST